MDAIWSFWSKPYRAHRRSTWVSEKHHLLAWVLSLETARPHFARTCLYTDDAGARLLIDQLGLPFDMVSTALNACIDDDPGWWATGKIHAYCLHDRPFVHIDTDVFLWKKLPDRVVEAGVFAQHPEPFTVGASYYKPQWIEQTFRSTGRGWLPPEWKWYRRSGEPPRGECCGIFGGTNLDFIHHYAESALNILKHPLNQPGWACFQGKSEQMVTIEQYFLAACVEYHRAHTESLFQPVHIRYLFDSYAETRDPLRVAEVGYTHLIAGAKHDPGIGAKLELSLIPI